jgi:hypothetical protein
MITKTLIASIASASACFCAGLRTSANAPEATAAITEARYCFERVRGINSERMPVPALTVQLIVRVSFTNAGTNPGARPLILPLDHERVVYMALAPGVMKVLPKPMNLLEPKVHLMAHLPPDVNPANPVDPNNGVFAMVRAVGSTPLYEEKVTVPVYRNTLRTHTDLRGHRVYLRLQLEHRGMTPALEADLSDRWAGFGVPWTGTLRTNTFVLDVPAAPQAVECSDK